jgi:hypothetical protein
MGELYDDRRQEPRFATSGTYYLQSGSTGSSGRVHDLSLNGAMLEETASQPLVAGARVLVVLNFPGQPEFTADVLVQHIANGRVGVEFYDMTPEHFSALARLVEQHRRGAVQSFS